MRDAEIRNVEETDRSATDPEPNSELRRQLCALLNAASAGDDLETQLPALQAEFDDSVYSELIPQSRPLNSVAFMFT